MTDIAELKNLIGDNIPSGGIPAAWWITTDTDQIAAYDQWTADYDAHRDRVDALAKTLGVTVADAIMTSWGKTSQLKGFNAPREMRMYAGHPDHKPAPEGWRIDSKSNLLVPKRRTKADRESQASKDFAAVGAIPNVRKYLTGLPVEIYLDDRDFGGTIYGIQYRRGDQCVMAFSGGDPDRCASRDTPSIDGRIWGRQKLSTLLALREDAAEKAAS